MAKFRVDKKALRWNTVAVATALATGFSRSSTKTGSRHFIDGIFMPKIRRRTVFLWCGGGGSPRACRFLCTGLLTPVITPPYGLAAIGRLK